MVKPVMLEGVEIRGGAGEFEAAVVAIVLDSIAREESAARMKAPNVSSDLPAWMRATPQSVPHQPRPVIRLDRR